MYVGISYIMKPNLTLVRGIGVLNVMRRMAFDLVGAVFGGGNL